VGRGRPTELPVAFAVRQIDPFELPSAEDSLARSAHIDEAGPYFTFLGPHRVMELAMGASVAETGLRWAGFPFTAIVEPDSARAAGGDEHPSATRARRGDRQRLVPRARMNCQPFLSILSATHPCERIRNYHDAGPAGVCFKSLEADQGEAIPAHTRSQAPLATGVVVKVSAPGPVCSLSRTKEGIRRAVGIHRPLNSSLSSCAPRANAERIIGPIRRQHRCPASPSRTRPHAPLPSLSSKE
jgi:hypothetical protein